MRQVYCLLIGCFLAIGMVQAQDLKIPPRPNPPRLVNDLAGVLQSDQVATLENKLLEYNDTTSTQIAIVTIPSTNGRDIAEVGLAILRDWGIGTKDKNNGILILAAIDDRKIRIEVGTGMEGVVPDAIANRIIDENIKPNFKAGDYYQGFDEAVDRIIEASKGEYKGTPNRSGDGSNVPGLVILAIIIVVIISILNNRGGGGGNTFSRRGWWWVGPGFGSGFGGSSRGGSGWGGGSSGGGGFGGFGGGSGSGGGASGSW